MMNMSSLYSRRNGNRKNYRPLIFQLVVIVSFLILAVRLYVIQFVERQTYVLQAEENRFDQISIPATRGIITDRYGVPLAVNVPSANVTVTPALLPDNEAEEMAVLRRLASLINIPLSGELNTVDERGIPQRSLLTMVREEQGIAPYRPIVVKSDVPLDVARQIIADQGSLPGVDVEWVSVRSYPTGALTSHIIGYMGPIPESLADEYEARGYVLDRDRIGYDGVEFSLQEWLAGSPGLQAVERDVAGQIRRTIGDPRPAQPGYNVRLTIDVELQQAAQQALVDEINRLNQYYGRIVTERGVVIASNPRTGEILAMVSWPTYDNSRFARAIDYPYYLQVSQDPLHPLFNQAISSLYPPGSIFKVITATAVLEEGVVTPDYLIYDPGQIQLENRYYPNDPGQAQTFVCWIQRGTGRGHGYVDMIRALAWSCDVYFYKVGGGYRDEVPGIGLGIERLGEWMRIFGLGEFTGIELAGEIDGIIPDPAWKRRTWGENWSTGDTYNSAFGQGYVTVTPLQMLNVLNAIANDGVQTRPTLVYEVSDADGHVIRGFQPDVVGQLPVSPENLRIVQEGMRAAVTIEGGTAVTANLPYVAVAGKTGTAEYCDNEAAALDLCVPGNWPAHAWFMAYAPYINPEISVIAFVYNGGEGAFVALPIVRDVLDAYFRLKTERLVEQQAQQTPQPTPLSVVDTPTPLAPAVTP
jgi:penicillin-binding protein 2